MWEKKHTNTVLLDLQVGATTLESSMEIPQKTRNGPTHLTSAIPLLGLYPKDLKSAYYSDTATSMFIAAQFTIYTTVSLSIHLLKDLGLFPILAMVN